MGGFVSHRVKTGSVGECHIVSGRVRLCAKSAGCCLSARVGVGTHAAQVVTTKCPLHRTEMGERRTRVGYASRGG